MASSEIHLCLPSTSNSHRSSGDTGVSATLIMHGTPPFQVYYRMQRDKEKPLEVSKTFTSSRADLTLQPERSGHYVFSFVAISDANYRKIELPGPSIDQMIHPVASVEFSDSQSTGRGKKIVSTCSGDTVDIDVDLRASSGLSMLRTSDQRVFGRELVHGTWRFRLLDLDKLTLWKSDK